MIYASLILQLTASVGAGPVPVAPADPAAHGPTAERSDPSLQIVIDDGRGTPYVVNKSDNICGLDEPRQLTNPAEVDYDALLDATPEVQKIEKDKIDRNSSEGITLMTKARARVLKACESVRASQGHCSVWKEIRRRDKKAIPDITDAVKRLL